MKTHHICILFSLLVLGNPAAKANNEDTWEDISDVGAYGLIATALILPGTRKDWTGLRQAAYSIGTATVTAQIGKALIDEERPDNSDDDSFPVRDTPLTPSPQPPPCTGATAGKPVSLPMRWPH